MPANVNVNVNLIPNTKQVDVAFDSISKRASSVKFGQPLGRISGDVTEFRKSLEAATARVTAFGLTAGAIYKVSEAIRAGARATVEIDKQLVELNTFLGQSRDQLEGFSQSLFKVARNAAVPFEAASEAAKEFARQGLSANEVLRRTEDALTLARISGISYADAVNGVTTAINSFNKEALTSTDIVNKLIAVDTRFAVSSAQLNEALSRVGSSAEESGISIDKLIATVTAAQQITGRGGAVIGNALKTIFTRLQRPEVLSQLEQLGVAIKDQNGFLLDGLSVLKNYADATKNLSQIEKSRTAELIGGIYQINQVNALIKDLSSSNSVYASALKISSAATDEAKKKNEELNKSLSALLQQTKNQAQEAAAALGKPFLEPIVKIGSSFSQTLLKFVNPTSDLLGKSEETGRSVGESFFKGTASVLGKTLATSAVPLLIGIGGTLLGKMIAFGVKSVKDVGKSFDDMFVSEKSLASQKAVNDILSQSPKLVALVQKGTISLAAAEQAVLQTLKEQNRQLKTQEALRARIIPTVVAKGGPTRVRASGYVPTFGNAQEEVAMAKAYGAKNPKAKLIQATIKGKTQPVMVNSEEDIIPNFAGTGDTAIIPKYRKMQDIPRMSSGYVPNFSWSKTNKMPKEFLAKYPESRAAIKAGRMYSPEVRGMLQKLQSGENIDRDLLEALIERDIPIREVVAPSSIKNLPSKSLIRNALDKEQAKRVGKLSELPAGSNISVRQDVPSMTRKGVGVVKTLGPEGFKSYDSFVAFDNPVMNKSTALEKASLAIGAGANKSPLLKISGTLSENQSLPKDLSSWTQVGFNPDRHSYYYDRKTKKPVVGGSKAIQIGNTVFVKDAQYGKKEDFLYAGGYIPNFSRSKNIINSTARKGIEPRYMPSDADYLSAVQKGDIQTAQRMVDEAAKAAGYNVGPVYHGVRERYRMGTESSPPAILPATKFNKWIASEANYPAFYASRDRPAVERWAKRPSNVMSVYLKAQNTAKEGDTIISSSFIQKDVVDKLKSLGYDSVEGGRDFHAHEIAVFDTSQIKSADPITRDDAGNVIPLSQRFKAEKENFLYARGYVPNFSSISGSFGSVSKINEKQIRKTFFSGAGQSGAGEIANEFLASRKLSEQIQASRELGYQGMRGGYISDLFEAPNTYGTLKEAVKSGSIVKDFVPGKTAAEVSKELDAYTGEFQNFRDLVQGFGRLAAKQINSGKALEARDLANTGNLMLNDKAEAILTKIIGKRNPERFIRRLGSSWKNTSRMADWMAKKGARISLIDPGVFGGLDKSRKKQLSGLGYEDNYRGFTGINAAGYIPNFAKSKFVQNIVDSYKASLTEKDPIRFAQAEKGESYYPVVNSELKNLSSMSGHSLEKLAYSLAALSGNTADLDARRGLERILNNQPYDDLAVLPANVKKVKKMLSSSGSSDELVSILGKGAKTQNFAQSLLLSEKFSGFGKYKNPLGTPSVMDSWAIYVRNGGALKDKYSRKAVSKKQKSKLFSQSAAGYKYYNTLVKEYGEAAKILGVPVRELQARTWGWARGQMESPTRNKFASGYIPNFSNPRIVGQGSNLFISSLYDTLSGKFGGGPEYPFVRPGMGAAFLNEEKTKDMIKLIKPFVESGSRVIFGAQAGRMGGDLGLIQGLAGNKMVVEALKTSYPKLTSKFIQEGTSTADLTSLFNKFYKTLGPDKMREIVSPFIEPDILKFYQKNKNFGASISRLAEFGSESLTKASSSEHSIYPAAIRGKALSRIEPVNAEKLFKIAGNLSDEETKKLFGTVRIAKLPIGFRFEKGDAASKLLGLSQGYIPNFAGLSDAISREKTMSGLPASQIMAHFDRGGNPIAVTNKKHEPNGLKDVVPNFAKIPSMGNASKLFKKLFAGGSGVPNPVTGSFQLTQNQFYTQFLDELAEREVINKNISTAAGYGLPIGLGGANIYKSLTTPGLGKGARAVGIATGIGQIVGGAGLAYTAGGDLDQRIQSRKFENALDRSKKAFTDLAENTTELSASLSKLDAAYKDPKADPKEIVKLVKTREDLIKKITIKNPELVSRLAGQTSISDQITVLEENLKKAQTQEAIRTSALEFGRKGKITGQQAPAELSSFFNEIINRANTDIFKTDLSQATTANFGEILKKAGLDVKEFSDQLNSDQLKKAFIEALKVAQGIEKISANQAKEIARISKPLAARRQVVEDARDIRTEIKKALEQKLPELAELAGTFSRRAGISASSEATLAIKKADAAVSFQNSLLTQLNDKEFLANLSPAVEARLRNIEAPGAGAGRELESLQKLPGLSEAQSKGIQKLIDFNSQQSRDINKATIIAEESKKIQLKFLALQEKIAFGGDIRASLNPQMRAEAMASSIRGPLTYQLGSMIGSRRGQVAGATDFLTDTLQKYPGLLMTKGGKEPSDIQAVKAELTRLNASDMQKDLFRRAGMAQMMGLGQTANLLRGKAFDQSYLLESAGLKTNALFGSPEIPKDIQKAMGDLEKFNVESVRQAKAEDATLRGLENIISPIKEKLIEVSESQSKALITAFENGLKSTFGTTGIKTTLVNVTADVAKFSESGKAAEAAPAGVPSSANGLTKYSNSIADAVKREKTALASRGIMGVPNFAMADINLERSPDLVNASNPAGFAITNSIDEKNGLRSLGMRSSGFVPNYALPSFMSASNLDKARSVLTNADDAQSLLGNIKEGNIGGAAMDLAGPALDAAKFAAKNVAKKAGLGAAGIGLDIGEYIVKPLSEKLGVTDYLADKMYNALYAKPEKSNIARASDAYNSRLGNDLIDPSPEYMKKAKVPNFAKSSNIDPLLERIYGPKAGATKTPKAVKTPPASIQGVSASTMPFYPEGAMERTYPKGPRLSISNVNPYGRVLTKAERAAAGELIPGASRNPFTGQFMSKKDIDLVQTIKAGKEAKAATLAQRKALIEIERATRPAGPNPIFAQTAREASLAQIGAAKYAERQALLSRLASPIFDTALDPEKKMSAQDLQNRLKITTERPVFANSINARRQREAAAAKAEGLKQAEINRRQNLANKYFQSTADKRAEMKAFSEARQARLGGAAQSGGASLENYLARKDQLAAYEEGLRRGEGRPSFRSDYEQMLKKAKARGLTEEQIAKNISRQKPSLQIFQGEARPTALGAGLGEAFKSKSLDPKTYAAYKKAIQSGNLEKAAKIASGQTGSAATAKTSGLLGSIAKSMPTSGIAGRAVRAGAFGLKGLGIAGAAGFGITQGLEAYVAAKEGEYKKATLAGLSSAASFASLVKGAGKVAGPAGVALAGLTDLDLKTLTLASDWKDILGRKGEGESIGLADIAGTGLAAVTALPALVGLLGYRTGNILENKLGLGTKLGDLAAGSMTARASYEAGIRPKGGMTVNEAVKANQLVAKKSELVGQINKLNQISGNPLISRDFQISASRRGQEAAAEKEVEDLKKKLDEESIAAKAAMAGRVSGKVKEEMARLDKESEARDEGQRSKLRKTFLESFEKNAEANGFLTTSDRVNYLLSQEGKNGLGSFKPTDFKDADFARSFNAYKTAREAQAAREANQVIPASTIEFRNRPIPSFPQDVLEEATRTGRSAERVISDREENAAKRGAVSQGMTIPEINSQLSRDYTAATGLQDFPKDVLEEAARRRVTAEQVMQERANGIVPNFAAMSNSMMASGDVYSRMRMSAPRMSFPSAAQGSVPNFAIGEFSDAITEAMRNGITSAFPNGPSSSSVSNSNVINIDGRTSIQNAPDEAMQGIISILFDKIPELKKLGPAALNFKR